MCDIALATLQSNYHYELTFPDSPSNPKSAIRNSKFQSLRRAYRGIAYSDDLQEMFRDSLRPQLLSAEDASQAIETGVEGLFRLPAIVDDSGFDDDDESNSQPQI